MKEKIEELDRKIRESLVSVANESSKWEGGEIRGWK